MKDGRVSLHQGRGVFSYDRDGSSSGFRSVDAALLGAMHPGRIGLQQTSEGTGVRPENDVAPSILYLRLGADGRLETSGTFNNLEDVTLASKESIRIDASLVARDSISIFAPDITVANGAHLQAEGSVILDAGEGSVEVGGVIDGGNNVIVNAGALRLTSAVLENEVTTDAASHNPGQSITGVAVSVAQPDLFSIAPVEAVVVAAAE